MPGVERFPCPACHYVAGNRRMLARHAVLIHSEKKFKCPVCPFVTRYAANWYRHKRDLHGLTKVTNCEVCGFLANSTPELAAHKETEHPEHLQIGKFEDKYAKERERLSGGHLLQEDKKISGPDGVADSKKLGTPVNKTPNTVENKKVIIVDDGTFISSPEIKLCLQEGRTSNVPIIAGTEEKRQLGSEDRKPKILEANRFNEKLKGVKEDIASEDKSGIVEEDLEDDEPAFFEPITVIEEFGEASVLEDLNCLVADYDEDEEEDPSESITFSLPLNGLGDEYGPAEKNQQKDSPDTGDNLGPLKVKRSYNCLQCGLLTSDPREYLYHLKNNHGEKITIFECKYCIYASKHFQKLHRHCKLVHRQQIANDPEYQKQLEAQKEKKVKPVMNKLAAALQAGIPSANGIASIPRSSARARNTEILKCSQCSYQTRNKGFLQHHEKTVHLKKSYSCAQCGYSTNERGRYCKHIKYHSLPKMQCEFCFFKTAYKWNMERHMKNHESGAEGSFRCDLCNFTTSTKQSFKSHVTNHHNNEPELVDNFIDPDEVVLGDNPDDSVEWEDIEDLPNEEDDSFMIPDENETMEVNNPPENKDDSEVVWKDGKSYQKGLKCKLCDFKAAWPFEMKKHEENHRSQKKHECPLCGMRFEHIAWLTKHLRRVHQENSQAKNIAAAYELLKPGRRRPGKEYAADSVLPIFQEVLKNKTTPNKVPEPPKNNSMLSTLLNKPLQPFVPTSLSKFHPRFKSKAFASATNMSRQLTMNTLFAKSQGSLAGGSSSLKSRNVPTCNVCGYKTRWISELQRHMRVHSHEKPFQCPKCKYHCKWKGDLNRHLMKYHGIKVPSSTKKTISSVPKLKLRKSSNDQDFSEDWQQVNPEVKRSLFPTNPRSQMDEAPLDLTTKDTFPNIYQAGAYEDPYEFSLPRNGPSPTISATSPATRLRTPLQNMQEAAYPAEESPVAAVASSSTKRKYQCPFCIFATTTASRFHVHIVQHYNRRPFCCSVCEYNSNWEWDITKHIKLKNCRDKFLNKACVLLTDESGRRNYEKYEKYLVDINAPPPAVSAKPPGAVMPEVNTAHNINRTLESPAKNCSYDFRNIGSNFEDTPENIVVTPDINISEVAEAMDTSNAYYSNVPSNVNEKGMESRSFYCKHCNFKHSTKRVVVSHLSVHAGIKPFRCRTCGIASNWRHVIVRHAKDIHNGDMNEVEDRITYAQEGLAISLTSVNSNSSVVREEVPRALAPQFSCKICPYKCDKEFYIKFHMKQHRPREGALYRCEFCPYFVKFNKTLIRHMKLHNPSAFADISMEDTLDFEDMDDLSQNQIPSHIPDTYEIYQQMGNDLPEESITISFDQLNQFSFSDSVSPPKVKRHICEQCPYKTDNKTQYLYHKQFHRPNPSAPFKCNTCSYWATMQHLLTQHMKVHSGSEDSPQKEGAEGTESPDKSTSSAYPGVTQSPCEDDWADKMTVVYVKREGEVVKMFKCNFCPMMNKKKANVRVHQKMHGVIVNDGKFACSFCDYQCLNQGGLTNHLKIHQKAPEDYNSEAEQAARKRFFSYFCDRCPALFKSASDLEIHSRFHGSGMQFGCTVCDYRTKQKTHLVKHLAVHSPEYMAKREAANGPQVVPEVPLVKKIDQMLLLEASEMAAALKRSGEAAALLQRCTLCPALFSKGSTLTYHASLHGSLGEYKCGQCDYAVSRLANINAHALIHPFVHKKLLKAPPRPRKPPLRQFPCPKCPAVFYKQDRFDRHSELHGKNYKYGCQHCDYSVRFAANLIKHRNLHAANPGVENAVDARLAGSSPEKAPPLEQGATKPLTENAGGLLVEQDDRKVMFICDRCPYSQNRKDAVQAHQRRHWLGDGFKCPYCDYTSMQSSFLQTHIKAHITPSNFFPPQAFIKFESLKIFVREEEEGSGEKLLFDDQDVDRKEEEAHGAKRKAKTEETEPNKKRKFDAPDGPQKVPVVVLSDVLADKELMKWAPRLKIPKLKLTKLATDASTNEKIYAKLNISYDGDAKLQTRMTTAKPKPSLVVKISKVESSSNDKTMYSVCTKTSELPPSPVIKEEEDGISKDSPADNAMSDSLDGLKKEESFETQKNDASISSDIVPGTVLCQQVNGETVSNGVNGQLEEKL